jgi:hypothetical protein
VRPQRSCARNSPASSKGPRPTGPSTNVVPQITDWIKLLSDDVSGMPIGELCRILSGAAIWRAVTNLVSASLLFTFLYSPRRVSMDLFASPKRDPVSPFRAVVVGERQRSVHVLCRMVDHIAGTCTKMPGNREQSRLWGNWPGSRPSRCRSGLSKGFNNACHSWSQRQNRAASGI